MIHAFAIPPPPPPTLPSIGQRKCLHSIQHRKSVEKTTHILRNSSAHYNETILQHTRAQNMNGNWIYNNKKHPAHKNHPHITTELHNSTHTHTHICCSYVCAGATRIIDTITHPQFNIITTMPTTPSHPKRFVRYIVCVCVRLWLSKLFNIYQFPTPIFPPTNPQKHPDSLFGRTILCACVSMWVFWRMETRRMCSGWTHTLVRKRE